MTFDARRRSASKAGCSSQSKRTSQTSNILNIIMLNIVKVEANPKKQSIFPPGERCSKLQLKLNGNYSSLREILAPSLRDHNGSLRAVNFSNGACATLREDEVLSFRALLLARCRREAVFGLGFLGFSDSRLLGSFGGFSASRLLGLFDGFSTSRLDSAQFLFCQQSSP